MSDESQFRVAAVAEHAARLGPAVEDLQVVVELEMRELSGSAWVARFPTSRTTHDLAPPFRHACEAFLSALGRAGASVIISATLRPPERAYLMHWAWRVSRQQVDPRDVPGHANVRIRWDHLDAAGEYDAAASVAAARAMLAGYGIRQSLQVAPALKSRHIDGHAIDMSVSWVGTLLVGTAGGARVAIDSLPRSGMNTQLHGVGASYGVIKFLGGDRDPPHWSIDGR